MDASSKYTGPDMLTPQRYVKCRLDDKTVFVEVSKVLNNGLICGIAVNRDGERIETPIPGMSLEEGYQTHIIVVEQTDIVGEYRMNKHYGTLQKIKPLDVVPIPEPNL